MHDICPLRIVTYSQNRSQLLYVIRRTFFNATILLADFHYFPEILRGSITIITTNNYFFFYWGCLHFPTKSINITNFQNYKLQPWQIRRRREFNYSVKLWCPSQRKLIWGSDNMYWGEIQVLTAGVLKAVVFWDVAPCSLVDKDRRFGITHYLHHQIVSSSETSVIKILHITAAQKTVIFIISPWEPEISLKSSHRKFQCFIRPIK
jgi:hypothetical protein